MARVNSMGAANRLLRKLPEAVRLEAQTVAEATAFQFVQMVKPQIPKGSGIHRWQSVTELMHLRDVVRWVRRSGGAAVAVPVDAFYWKFLEWGTKHFGPRAYFRQTAAAIRPDHRRRMADALRRARTQVTNG